MLLEYSAYTDDKQFARSVLAPLAEGVIDFYDKHYERAVLAAVADHKFVFNALLSEKISKQAANAARRILQSLPDTPATNGPKTSPDRDLVIKSFTSSNPDMRFPVFWGPNEDWTPDQAHGGLAMMTLQSMLLKAEGEKLQIAPAWPKDWDVEFKLHAPGDTVVEGAIKEGKVDRIKTTPEKRLAELERFDSQ